MKTIGIVGSRRRATLADSVLCLQAFKRVYEPGDRIVSGGCEIGGDRFAEMIAKGDGLTIIIHYPAWKTGRRSKNGTNLAGIDRNTKIAEGCDILIALVATDRTGGAEDTITKCLKLGKEVILV